MTGTKGSPQFIPVLLFLIAGVAGALGQYLYKLGGIRLGTEALIRNWPLFSGMAMFSMVMVLMVWAFNLGGRMSVVYPVYATTFVWATLIGIVIDHEPYTLTQLAGVGVIVAGVAIVAIGAPQ